MMAAKTLEQLALTYAQAFNALRDEVDDLNWEINEAKKNRLSKIKAKVRAVKELEDKIACLIEAHPNDFEKPKTKVLHGIKLGFRKQKGTITLGDKTLELIKEKLTEKSDQLIVKQENVSKEAVSHLSAAEIKKIGVTITTDNDQVMIQSTDTNVDKLVKTLLKEKEVKL